MIFQEFLKKYSFEAALVLVILGMLVFSLANLTTKPRLWYDEGINIEFAKNFLDFGQLDMQTSPGNFSQLAYLFQGSGYPLSLPLSLFFWFFGFGSVQARVYMLVWMILALLSVFIFMKKLAGSEAAWLSAFLIATFASFHDSGRAVTGEIPGFVFLLWALYWIFWKNSYFVSGLLFGLAISSKTSVYISLLPAILVLLVWEKENFWKNYLKIFAGLIPPFLLRIWFIMPDPFSLVAWQQVINFFKNPFDSAISPVSAFLTNLIMIPKTYTILYFGLFTFIILFEYFRGSKKDYIYKKFFSFTITYNLFAFLYFLKSPGFLRYLIAADLLTFILLVIALRNFLSESVKKKIIFYLVVFGLISFQIFHLFNYAKIFYSDSEERVINFVNTKFKNNTVGIFNVPEIGAFVPADRKYQNYRMMGAPFIGINPIFYQPSPEILITRSDENGGGMLLEEARTLSKEYQFLQTVGRYDIYKRSKN